MLNVRFVLTSLCFLFFSVLFLFLSQSGFLGVLTSHEPSKVTEISFVFCFFWRSDGRFLMVRFHAAVLDWHLNPDTWIRRICVMSFFCSCWVFCAFLPSLRYHFVRDLTTHEPSKVWVSFSWCWMSVFCWPRCIVWFFLCSSSFFLKVAFLES